MDSNSPFARLAHSYAERGFSPLPIAEPYEPLRIKGKEPGYYSPSIGHPIRMSKWERLCMKPLSAHEIDRIIRDDPECGLGLAMGLNDVAGVDVDDKRAIGPVREILGGAHAPAKRGQKGATGFFRAPGVRSRKFLAHPVENAEGKIIRPTLVEILVHGNQTVIPFTIHPDTGEPYKWIKGSLEEIAHPRDLPILTEQHVLDIAELLKPFMPERDYDAPIEPVKVKAVNLPDFMRRRLAGSAQAAFNAQTARIANSAKPGRNDTLFKSVCSIGKFVHHGFIPESMLVQAFMEASTKNGLVKDNGPKDVRNTIADGLHCSRNDSLPELVNRERRAAA
jgi:hypothetical protein